MSDEKKKESSKWLNFFAGVLNSLIIILIMLIIILVIVGCDSNKPEQDTQPTTIATVLVEVNETIDIVEVNETIETIETIIPEPELLEADSEFTGRIVYEDRTPYVGRIKAVSEYQTFYSETNSSGYFEIGVIGGDRFMFSALSPYGDNKWYPYITPLIVPAYDSSEGYECPLDIQLDECVSEENELH